MRLSKPEAVDLLGEIQKIRSILKNQRPDLCLREKLDQLSKHKTQLYNQRHQLHSLKIINQVLVSKQKPKKAKIQIRNLKKMQSQKILRNFHQSTRIKSKIQTIRIKLFKKKLYPKKMKQWKLMIKLMGWIKKFSLINNLLKLKKSIKCLQQLIWTRCSKKYKTKLNLWHTSKSQIKLIKFNWMQIMKNLKQKQAAQRVRKRNRNRKKNQKDVLKTQFNNLINLKLKWIQILNNRLKNLSNCQLKQKIKSSIIKKQICQKMKIKIKSFRIIKKIQMPNLITNLKELLIQLNHYHNKKIQTRNLLVMKFKTTIQIRMKILLNNR